MADGRLSEHRVVRAAGGIVRRHVGDAVEVLLVHRPSYDDWSFPKGKCDGDESDEACACREVEEETGLTCRVWREIDSTRYVDRHGRDKVVRYWLMEPLAGTFAPSDEVDEVRWVTIDQAAALLSYPRDRELLVHVRG